MAEIGPMIDAEAFSTYGQNEQVESPGFTAIMTLVIAVCLCIVRKNDS
jgi:hypothetical protein